MFANNKKGTFIEKVSHDMFQKFDEWNHLLNYEAKSALTEVVAHIHDLAYGQIKHGETGCAEAHITPLSCGVGKTTAVNFCIKQLVQDGYDDGMLLLFFKIDEAEDFYNELTTIVGAENVALITTKHQDKNYEDKPVLIITQQRLCNRLANSHYNDVDLFKVRNRQGQLVPRRLRVWDEALKPAVSYAINTDELMQIAIAVGKYDSDTKVRIKEFVRTVEDEIKQADRPYVPIQCPSWDIKDWMLQDIKDDLKDKFLAVQGHTMSASQQGEDGSDNFLMTFKVKVPRDSGIWPMLVLDASYRVNQEAYDQMSKALPICPQLVGGRYTKSYAHMDVVHVNTTTSKSMWSGNEEKDVANRDKALNAIADALKKSDKCSLIICSKFAEELIREHLVLPPGVLPPRYLTYGRHTSSNEFKEFDNIIIAGLYIKPVSAWVGLLRAYKQMDPGSDVDHKELSAFIKGDLWDSLYQAAMRGRARQLDGGVCKPMNLTVLAARQYHYAQWDDIWQSLFPGCKVKQIATSFGGNAEKFLMLSHILNGSADREMLLTDDALAKVGLTHQQLKILLRKSTEKANSREMLMNALADKLIRLEPGKGRKRSRLVKVFEVLDDCWQEDE